MSHLRALLTERTDDSHASPVLPSLRIIHCFQQTKTVVCQALVRFFGLYRIKPHVPLVVCLPANSFEFQPCGRTPQAVCLTGYLRHTRSLTLSPIDIYQSAITLCIVIRKMVREIMQLAYIRLQLGLRRSLICFAPLTFVSQRQESSREPPSPLVFPWVSTHFTTPPTVPFSLKILLDRKYHSQFSG